MREEHADVYRKLGVEPVVNCGSSRSIYGNSTPGDPVRAAMESAAQNHVIMSELGEATGRRIGELTGAEWGLVTAGSATGLALGAAACAAANDPLRMLRLPQQFGEKQRAVIVPEGQRFAYDQAVRMTGAEVVEVADATALEAALDAYDVTAIMLLAEKDAGADLDFDTILPIARAAKMPIMVDAASEALSVPEAWTARGADLVVYSVSKLMRGPAASGLLLGREALVRAAWRNGPPHHSFGRVMKIGKEQIVGAVAALERWLTQDHAAEQQDWKRRLETIETRLRPINALKLGWHELAGGIPRLNVDWSGSHPDLTFVELQAELLARRPRILIDDYGGTDTSTMINPFALDDAGASLVAEALYEALTRARPEASDEAVSDCDLTGDWRISIDFATGPALHGLHLERRGDALTGRHETPFGDGDITGAMTALGFDLRAAHTVEGLAVRYRFVTEDCSPERLSGFVELGAASNTAVGPTTMRQFGRVSFTGERV